MGAGLRFFISYRRRSEDDRALAGYLAEGLKAAGHDVFIDIGMPVGTNWAAEISRRIEWCDFLVVLLSAESVQSEMLQGEVRRAHHRHQADGRPRILPLRVRFDGLLDYELDSYLSRLQYLSWRGPDDSKSVLKKLAGLQLATGEQSGATGSEPVEAPQPHAGAETDQRPRASADPRLSRQQPGGAIKASDPFYIRRDVDDRIAEIARPSPGACRPPAKPHGPWSSCCCRSWGCCSGSFYVQTVRSRPGPGRQHRVLCHPDPALT